ncbi:MAG: hypothetical protein WDN04_07390 [Rhodospirillales bacterium]
MSLPTSADLARQLRARAEPVLARFRPSSIAEAWDALLQNLHATV